MTSTTVRLMSTPPAGSVQWVEWRTCRGQDMGCSAPCPSPRPRGALSYRVTDRTDRPSGLLLFPEYAEMSVPRDRVEGRREQGCLDRSAWRGSADHLESPSSAQRDECRARCGDL